MDMFLDSFMLLIQECSKTTKRSAYRTKFVSAQSRTLQIGHNAYLNEKVAIIAKNISQ